MHRLIDEGAERASHERAIERGLAGRNSLPARTLRVARAFVETVFDDGRGIPAGDLDAFLVDLADWLGYAGARLRFGLRVMLTIVQWSPLFTIGRARRFTSLSPEARAEHLEKLEISAVGATAFAGVKTVLAIPWFEVWGAKDLPDMVRIARPPELIVRRPPAVLP